MPKPRTPAPARPAFTPVATRARHDGWTPEKQVRFVEALAESGCVTEACGAVGMSKQSAYTLRMRTDAQGFRVAWDAALDLAIRRLSDECYSRALHGEVIPHFYQGAQIGEHRRYDNRLAMFLLRYRDPLRYAATLDQMVYAGHPETAAIAFARARERVRDEAHGLDPADVSIATMAADGPPFATTPVFTEAVRQKEQAQVEGDGPVGGSHTRRNRILEKRRALHASAAAPRPAWEYRPEGPLVEGPPGTGPGGW